jgi:23S rRNA (adenine2503-C2)-methyltransferase
MSDRPLLDLDFVELRQELEVRSLPSYRAQQIWEAAYKQLYESYDIMTTLPKSERDRLSTELPLSVPTVVSIRRSPDRQTRKCLLRLCDGLTVESVEMEYADRATVCVSTQVGCPVGCAFCATGSGGFQRNLSAGEIIGQVLHAARAFRKRGKSLTNIVYMGMGEPLLNADATLKSIAILNDARGLALGARSFTVSTVGIVPGIERLSQTGMQTNLAVSLHAADDALRQRLIPINHTYSVAEILAACRRYVARTNRRVTFEVTLIRDVNDSAEDARLLGRRLSGILCHVNLIPFNPFPGCPWHPSPQERVSDYERILAEGGLAVSIRRSRGVEIEAGCGQLRRRHAQPRKRSR